MEVVPIPWKWRRVLLLLGLWATWGLWAQQPPLAVQAPGAEGLRLSWPTNFPGFRLEETAVLGGPWQTVAIDAAVEGAEWRVLLAPGEGPRFYRLRQADLPARVVESSPVNGEVGVAVTREATLRLSRPLASGVPLTREDLLATDGTRDLLGRIELSGDRTRLTWFPLENLPANARIGVVLRGDRLRDEQGRAVDADGDGVAGGTGVLTFETLAITAVPGTAVIGNVYASEPGPGGTNQPLAGVTITVDGAEETLRTTTDATGFFRLSPAPVGRFFVHVDGRTAAGSQWPGGAYYPFVGKAW